MINHRYLTADWIYPVSSPRIQHGVVIMDGDTVIDLTSRDNVSLAQLEYFEGCIIPGFINTHCHLELSHLKGKIGTGTGLIKFITDVVKLREASHEEIESAIIDADKFMWTNGIQAVGDICNKTDTIEIKHRSPITYYNFVEMYDFLQVQNSNEFTKKYKEVFSKMPGLKSAVPHAPYSVSPILFDQINQLNKANVSVSVHNQETQAEQDLFLNGGGEFPHFYRSFNLNLDQFMPNGTTSIHYLLAHMDAGQRTLFVHNTMSSQDDIEAAMKWNKNVFWTTCPNANLYIENRLPNYNHFINTGGIMTIGTDSLTSNWQLSILEEMKTINKYQSSIEFETLLLWATLNGAKALGLEEHFGSLEEGKQPGILVLNYDPENGTLYDPEIAVRRII